MFEIALLHRREPPGPVWAHPVPELAPPVGRVGDVEAPPLIAEVGEGVGRVLRRLGDLSKATVLNKVFFNQKFAWAARNIDGRGKFIFALKTQIMHWTLENAKKHREFFFSKM